MKFPIFILTGMLTFTLCLFSCSQSTQLEKADLDVLKQTGFDETILLDIRKQTNSAFQIAKMNPEAEICFKDSLQYVKFVNKDLKAICFYSDQHKAQEICEKLRDSFAAKDYFINISETNFGNAPDKVTVLKTNDKFDLLRFEATNGINFDLFIEDVIAKLKEWDKKYELQFTSVGFDFAEAEFKNFPKELDKFADEVYEFCPDIVDQGTGTIDALKAELKSTNKVYLWWD